MGPFDLTNIFSMFSAEISQLPFVFLQAIAIVGCVAMFLLYWERLTASLPHSLGIGVVMGLTCMIIMVVVHDEFRTQLKSIAVLDFIFISAILGGWRNALVTLAFVIAARGLFGGTVLLPAASADLIFFTIFSVIGHTYFLGKNTPDEQVKLTFKKILLLIFWRFLAGESSFMLTWLMGLLPEGMLKTVLIRRALGAWSVSVMILVPVMLLVRQTVIKERQLFFDPITKLPNRRELERLLHQSLAVRQSQTPSPEFYSLLLIKIANFKEMTQAYGYSWMDRFCIEIANAVKILCANEVIQPYNPQLFSFSDQAGALILKDTNKTTVQQTGLANRLFTALTLSTKLPETALQPSFSISVIDINLSPEFDVMRFLRSLSLLDDQQSGTVQFYEATLEQQVALNEFIHTKLSKWKKQGGIPVWLQPKILLENGQCYGAEALLRLQHPDNGNYVNPHSILLAADRNNKRQRLEWGITCSVIESLQQLPSELVHLRFSVNLTPEVFTEKGFARALVDHLDAKHVACERLIVEVIETSRFIPSDIVQENVSTLVESGVQLSLDDFGSGYASLSLLSQYPFHELKIDYAMTSQLDNPRVRKAVALSIEGANRYQASIVAEGIETEAQREFLLSMGVKCGQGFLFGKAMPFDAFVAFALAHTHK